MVTLTVVGRSLLFLSLLHLAFSHICLIYPVQRGGYNISTPGDYTCFQPEAPCGTAPVGPPSLNLIAGTTFTVLFQQNLNHYNPGWPGFLDVAYAVGVDQTSDSQFSVLKTVSDYWPHLQAQQTNFSISFTVPDIECSACTLQVRYHPNKPTEPIFHQCADISITQVSSNSIKGNVAALGYFGPLNSVNQLSTFFSVNATTGKTAIMSQPIRIGQRSLPSRSSIDTSFLFNSHIKSSRTSNVWMSQGLITSSSDHIYFIGDSSVDVTSNSIPTTLFSLSSDGEITGTPLVLPTPQSQWSALVATQSNPPFIIVSFSELPTNNNFIYSAYWLWENGTISSSPIGSTTSQTAFVNTFFADYSACSQSLYLLVGHEDTPFSMFVKLFTFNTVSGAVSEVLVQNNEYTIQEIHASHDCTSPYLYSLSPGLFGKSGDVTPHGWSVITIDPSNGTVVDATEVFPSGLFKNYYGGIAYGPMTPNNQILHLFTREIDNAKVIASVNTQTSKVDTFSYIDLGDVESVFDFNSLIFIM